MEQPALSAFPFSKTTTARTSKFLSPIDTNINLTKDSHLSREIFANHGGSAAIRRPNRRCTYSGIRADHDISIPDPGNRLLLRKNAVNLNRIGAQSAAGLDNGSYPAGGSSMGADAIVVFFGIRFDLDEDDIESVEIEEHPYIEAAKRVQLQTHIGRESETEPYFLFIGSD